MGVNLQKGQKVDLTKGNAGLKKLMVGLGWDPIQQQQGFLSSLFGGKQAEIDCDAIAVLLDERGKLTAKENVVYFGNLKHYSGSVQHMGDNLTGAGEGDDEQIFINLPAIPGNIGHIVFSVNIYQARERGQHFGMIRNAFIRIVNADNNQELIRFNLSENNQGKMALIAGEVYRHNGEWKFNAIGEATTDGSISELVGRYV